VRLCPQPVIAPATISIAPIQHSLFGRTTIAAIVLRAMESLLASWKCRPTSRVGSQQVQIASGMPNRGSMLSLLVDPESWLSTQVYTPFGRPAVFEIFFFRFPQVAATHFRSRVCQNFHYLGTKCTFVYELTDRDNGCISRDG
jgi:hypothetical protein